MARTIGSSRRFALVACVVGAACTQPTEGSDSDSFGPASAPSNVPPPASVAPTTGSAPSQSPVSPSAISTPQDASPEPRRPSANQTPAGGPGEISPAADAAPAPASGESDAEFLGLSVPDHGFRLVSRGREIAPGGDEEYCEVAELPGDPEDEYSVTAVEAANGVGSHHLIVTAADFDSLMDRRLRSYDLGDQLPCISADSEFGREGIRTIVSSQTPYVMAEYPEGVGMRLYGGQRIVFDYHYFNFGESPILARSAIAIHTREPGAPITPASYIAFTNMTLDVPPGMTRTYTATCAFEQDAMVMAVGRHTHSKGTDFSVWFNGGAHDGELIWTSNDWQHDLDHVLDEPVLVRAGEGFRFACGFENDGDVPLRFGISSTDEMCILVGGIYSDTPGREVDPQECVITWIDDDGMGHDARDAGGFPKAEPNDALACHTGSLGLSFISECLSCICDSCGTIMARCNEDADCKPLLDCNSACMMDSAADCTAACEDEMFAHSSAVGLLTQVGECMASQCSEPCMIDDPRAR